MVDPRLDVLAAGRLRGRQGSAARAALYLAVAYVTLTTADIDIARVPLKLFVVAFAMLGWLADYRPWSRPRGTYKLSVPVLTVGVVIPIVWFAVALLLHHRHDPAQAANTNYAVQQASRFVYLLLYFPVLDEVRRCAATDDRPLFIHRVWLWPTLALCAISALFYLGYALLGIKFGGGNVGPFQGAIALEATGTFRVYLIDDVMLIPAMALLLVSAQRGRLGRFGVTVAAALLATAYVSHTRGIWLGMIITAALTLLLSRPKLPRSRQARAIAGLLACAFLAAFVINADPDVSHRAVSLVTRKSELSTSYRLEQATQLLAGFRRHPVLGSGLGATLPSGFRRNETEPWSFELTYLQLLFQLGIVGSVLLLTVPAYAVYRGTRALARVEVDGRTAVAAAIGGITALLFTSGGNPYLMTSVGMLALAVLVSMTERASMMIPAPAAPADFVPAPSRRRVPRTRAVYCIVAFIGVLGVAEFARSRQETTPTAAAPPALPATSPVAAARLVFPLPSSYIRDHAAQLVSDGESTGPSSLWEVTTAARALRVSQWEMSSGRIVMAPSVPAGSRPRGQDPHFGIVSLGASHPAVLGVMTSREGHVDVELRDLAHAGRALVAGATPVLPLAPGEHRDVGLGRWVGTTPDLIVVDRSTSVSPMHVKVFSATSHFRDELLDVVVPAATFRADAFSVLIGAVNSPTTDLLLVSRGPTATSHTEVHALLGPQAFQAFGEQSPVNLPALLPHATNLLVGRRDGRPVLYAADRHTGILEVVQIS